MTRLFAGLALICACALPSERRGRSCAGCALWRENDRGKVVSDVRSLTMWGSHFETGTPPPPPRRDALEAKGPQRRPQRRSDRRLEEVAKAVGGGYCRLQMP